MWLCCQLMLPGGVCLSCLQKRDVLSRRNQHIEAVVLFAVCLCTLPTVGTPTQSHCELNREQQTENQQQHTMRDESISIQKLFTEAPAAAAAAEAANHSALPTRDHWLSVLSGQVFEFFPLVGENNRSVSSAESAKCKQIDIGRVLMMKISEKIVWGS